MQTRSPIARRLASILVIGAVEIAVAGCSNVAGQAMTTSAHEMAMAALSEMPAEVQAAPVVVQQAYQFAAANPDIVQQLPCYCGCGAMGHTSNYACYVARVDVDGKREYDSHALGCSICVDITQDAIRLTRKGKSPAEIRAYVDQTYSKYGPSNMP
jgi:hypothetical protein